MTGDKDNLPEDYFIVTDAFYAANDLMNYLLENGYLLRHEGTSALGIVIKEASTDLKANSSKQDIYVNKTLSEFLDKLTYHYIPTEALKDLVKNKFRTKDERHNRKTRTISIVSAIVASLSLLVNYCSNKAKDTIPPIQTIIIDTNSIRQLSKKVSSVTIDTGSVNFILNKLKNKSRPDTLKKKK